ncbi:MAG: isoprenylcysteine carboxylmethyltransferase family protein [Spirochaetaceae bacterium]|nr:isoprenylcysteine carboxylmethyltransferase family protein [Spirochaetaceae bacterium]MCF7938906.1 isoprenylcysteine carboxylmethyltransferase family protein [Spirochaetales bacterium]
MRECIQPQFASWWAVLVVAAIFGVFVLFVPFYRKADRKPAGAFLAFITLFAIEMYGAPLSMYFPESFGAAGHYIYLACILFGGVLIVGGWARVYRDYWSREENAGRLVREGLYRYIRHPQYTGFLLISMGVLFEWATLLLMVMWPVLALQYHRLARKEEADLEEQFGSHWYDYRAKTGMYLPRVLKKRRN